MKIIYAVLFVSLLSCKGSGDCSGLKDFDSHEQAIEQIREATFGFTEEIDTHKSSWIKTGYFYSCDGDKGFVIIRNKEDFELIFQDVPLAVWEGFKVADSHGTFANEKIIGTYPLKIRRKEK